jgi:hypothetical protein
MIDQQLEDFLLAVSEDLDPTFLFERVVGNPDPWQVELLRSDDGRVKRIAAKSIEIPRLRRKVEFDRAHMPKIRFQVEHECSFIGSGRSYFNPIAIEAALAREVQPLWAS